MYGGAYFYDQNQIAPLSITYSDDKGQTWETAQISSELRSVRVKYSSFPTELTGFVFATNDRTMSQEVQLIFKTNDGGQTWQQVGEGPTYGLLNSANFINDSIGLMSYVNRSVLYRTEDGG